MASGRKHNDYLKATNAWLLFLICVLPTNVACQFAPKLSAPKWPWSKKAEKVPDRILAVWSDSVLHQPGLTGVRGFGGRVYFYQTPETDPITVDGAIAVYAFDADEMEPERQQPLRKYVFTAEQLSEHMSKSSIGPSYSLWVPWDEVGGPSKRLSLITRFEATEGGTVISDPAIKLLPGIPTNKQDQLTNDPRKTNPAQLVVHQKQEPVISSEQIGRAVQTIDLPPSFQQQLRSAGSGEKSTGPSKASNSQPGSDINPSLQLPNLPNLPNSGSGQASGSVDSSAVIPASATTTQVFDLRTRKGQPGNSYQPFRDRQRGIREGRSIDPPRPRQPAVDAPDLSPAPK